MLLNVSSVNTDKKYIGKTPVCMCVYIYIYIYIITQLFYINTVHCDIFYSVNCYFIITNVSFLQLYFMYFLYVNFFFLTLK